MIEDRALERLLERAGFGDEPRLRLRTDAEHRRIFGFGWDDPVFGFGWDDPDRIARPDIDPPDVLWRLSDEETP